mgnify:CR=1 FL=1
MENNFELACFIGGIINTLNEGKPEFGNYLMDQENSFIDIEKKAL